MISKDDLSKQELIDLLNRCWMTHDGMWFYHVFQEFGIEKANKLNKAAIKLLAPIETGRTKKALGRKEEKFRDFEEFRDFIVRVAELFIPALMGATMSFPGDNTLRWEFKSQNCFAYKGMKRIGAIDQYECGVIYRLQCWFDSLGLNYAVAPQIKRCLMLGDGNCSGEFKFSF